MQRLENTMSEKNYTHGLSYDLIRRAAHGEMDALEEILRIYEPFHNALVSRDAVGADSRIYREINEDWKVELQMKLMDAIQRKWRELL